MAEPGIARRTSEHFASEFGAGLTGRQLVEDCAAGRLIPSQRYGTQPKWVERAAEAARAARP